MRRQVLELLYQQKSPAQIQNILALDAETFDELWREALDEISTRIAGEAVEHTYAHFLIDMTAIMRKLAAIADQVDEETESGKAAVHPRDAVSALKAQADIRRDILSKGRELGLIKPVPGSEGGRLGIDLSFVSGLSNAEIQRELYRMLAQFRDLESGLVEADFVDSPIGDIFSGGSVQQLDPPNSES